MELDSTGNPLAVEASDARRVEVEAAIAALEGDSAPRRHAEAIDAFYEAELTSLRAELNAARQASSVSSSVASIVAQLSEAPINWHQATLFFFTAEDPEDATMHGRAPLLLALGYAQVLLALATAVGVAAGVVNPTCLDNDGCYAKGSFCWVGGSQRCQYCGQLSILQTQVDAGGGVLNEAYHPDFVGYNETGVAEACHNFPPEGFYIEGVNTYGDPHYYSREGVLAYCAACVSGVTGAVDGLNLRSLSEASVAAMGTYDWVALFFSSIIVSLTVVGELKDVVLCLDATAAAGDKFSGGLRFAMKLLHGVRRWSFLPLLVLTVPLLVIYRGGDALSVCFNSIGEPPLATRLLVARVKLSVLALRMALTD
eukprot:COSAG02_NODE_5151_length_4588_cov_2.905324_2_plen_369_part_00